MYNNSEKITRYIPENGEIPAQKEIVHRFIEDNDEFLVIILDACRIDYLCEAIVQNGNFDTDTHSDTIVPAFATASNTKNYVEEMWPDRYDLTYYSGIPHIGSNMRSDDYNAHEHFQNVVNVWETGWDDDKGTVIPEKIRQKVLEGDADREVAHFIQPHYPYVGAYSLEHDGDYMDSNGGPRAIGKKYGKEEMRKAYRSNLHYVLDEGVAPIVESYDKPIIVTADHGESLGEEHQLFGHNPQDLLERWIVPIWVINYEKSNLEPE